LQFTFSLRNSLLTWTWFDFWLIVRPVRVRYNERMAMNRKRNAALDIGVILFHARAFNPRGVFAMSADPLQHAVAGLWTLLRERKVDFVLVGGIALLQYVAGRNTEDIDLIVPESALERLPEIHITDRNAYFALGTLGDLRIDLWLTANPLFAAVQQQHSTPRKFAGDTIPTATVEGLLLLKLYALPSLYRGGDFARVSLLRERYRVALPGLPARRRPAAGAVGAASQPHRFGRGREHPGRHPAPHRALRCRQK
jgi:hypothetical protein